MGESFLQSQETYEREPDQISPVLHWYSKPAYSECCAYILAMINYHDNPVTDIGWDPDEYIVNNEHSKKCPLAYAIDKEFFCTAWLSPKRENDEN